MYTGMVKVPEVFLLELGFYLKPISIFPRGKLGQNHMTLTLPFVSNSLTGKMLEIE